MIKWAHMKIILEYSGGVPRDIVVNVLDYYIIVSKFEL